MWQYALLRPKAVRFHKCKARHLCVGAAEVLSWIHIHQFCFLIENKDPLKWFVIIVFDCMQVKEVEVIQTVHTNYS